MYKVMRLFVKSILSVLFFFIFAAFLGKNGGHRRVFCHSKQFILRPFAHRPLAQKVAQPLSRRPATLAQICRRHPPSSLPIVFHFFAAPSVFSATSSIFSVTSSVLSAASSVFSAAPSVFFADSLPLLCHILHLLRHILHLDAALIHLLRCSGCLARHSDPPVRHRANLARYQLYVDFRA